MYVEKHMKRQIIKLSKLNKLITAVSVLFLIKLRWPKDKSLEGTKARKRTLGRNMS